MIRTLIVDDEPLALDVMETYLERLEGFELVARCQNALEALELIKKGDIDLVFLDIQMPQLTGIELVKSLSNPPLIIFTTAYSNYAVEGYELNVIDYLLKPISFDRFVKAANKASDQLALKEGQVSDQEVESDGADFIFVKADKKLIKLKYDDIIYIEGLKDYVIIRTETGRVISLQTMKSLELKMPSDKFIRIHRSYILNMDKIEAIVGNMVEIIEKKAAKHLPIGKNYRDKLHELVNQNRL